MTRTLLLVAAFLGAGPAHAAQAELFGPSVGSASMGGVSGALEDGVHPLTTNAAAIGLMEGDAFTFQYWGGHVFLSEVEGVTRLEEGDAPMPQVTVQPHVLTAGLGKRIGPWVVAGAHVQLPLPWIYFHETKDPWVPYSMRWQNRVARGMGTAGVSVKLPLRPAEPGRAGLQLGFAMSLRPRGIINVDLDIVGREGDPPQVAATLRDVDLAARYVVRPQASLLLDFGLLDERLSGLRFGASYKPASRTDISPIALDVEVINLEAVNALFALVELIRAEVYLGLTDMFDPHQVRLSLAVDRPKFAVAADVQVNLWSQLAASYGSVVTGLEGEEGALTIDFGADDGPEVYEAISGRLLEDDPFRDTVDAALGVELKPADWLRIRAGARFTQGAVAPSPGASGLLDGHNLGGGAGVGFRIPVAGGAILDGPLRVDAGVQVQRLFGVDLPKTDEATAGLELPVSYADDARWPGGWVVAGGASLGVTF